MHQTRFIARDKELRQLEGQVARARVGEPSVVLVSGEAGIGKTRLIAEAIERFSEPDDVVFFGHGVQLVGGELPFGVISDALRDLIRRQGVQTVRERSKHQTEVLAALAPDLTDARTPSLDRLGIFVAFTGLLEALASERLVWLAVEDLHWADSASRDLLSYMARAEGARNLIITATLRSVGEPGVDLTFSGFLAELIRGRRVTQCVLERLDSEQTEALARDIIGDSADHGLLQRVVRLSQGVPFLTENLIAGGLHATGPMPVSLRDLTLAQVARLAPGTQKLLRCASLVDGRLPHARLAGACQLSPRDAARASEEALSARILELTETGPGYRFRHTLLREAIASTVPPDEEILFHRMWAKGLQDDATRFGDPLAAIASAHHWSSCGDTEPAFAASIHAASVAQSVGAFDEQATALKRVVKLWSLVPNAAEVAERPRDDLILELIYALTMTGALDDVVSLVDDELRDAAVVRDPVLRAALRIERTWALLSLGRNDAAALADGAESVIAMLLEAPLRRCVIRACVHLGWLMSRSHPAASHQLLERAWHLSQESEDVNDRLFATNQYATQLAGSGRLDEALALFLDRLPTAREVVSPPAMQTVAGCAWCLNDLGQYDDAVCIAEEALRRIGSPEAAGGAWIQIVEPLCEAWIALGRWDDASRLLAQAEKIQAVRPWSNNLMGVLYCDLGRIKEAEIIAERAWRRLPALEEDTLTRPRVMVRGLGAHVAMSRNEVAQVRTILRPLWDAPGLLLESDEVWKVVLCAVKAEADAAARERSTVSASGAAHLRQIALVAETLHRVGRRDAASVLQYEAELDRCHGSADPSRWQGAAEAWGAIGHLHDEAWALLRVAECHSTKGSRGAATDVLRRAGTIARQLGASPLLSEISSLAERANLGLDQPPPAVHGDLLGRLTERERQVLKLVAIGSSNQQIANHLFISPKTASVHVSHILAKLEVVSRTEAASIAHRFGLVSE